MTQNITTDHEPCALLVEVLVNQGVHDAIISPGSRNAPLIVAFAREKRIKKHVIVDERSAAFVAVGIAQITNTPVAVICTSGSAVLNYAPAASEAFYRHLPIIFISADRPAEWIDQNDNQTIRQYGALTNVVKHTANIPVLADSDSQRWHINRTFNEAILLATRYPMGPVHINVQLAEPLCGLVDRTDGLARIIVQKAINRSLDAATRIECANILRHTRRVMIVVGIAEHDAMLEQALAKISKMPNVIVLTETIANLHSKQFIPTIDRTLSAIPADKASLYAPDLLITFGGALVSRMIKQFLRSNPPAEEWRIGIDHNVIDTMQHLTSLFEIEPAEFFDNLADEIFHSHLSLPESDYASKWKQAESSAFGSHLQFIKTAPWCDLKAFAILLPTIPSDTCLHLSNGTSIRYVQLFECPQIHRCYCNRGVAGIDGSTSTALGSSLVCRDKLNLLITGDMSLSYDISGLASQYNSPHFKIVVMCNGGGGIFRFIKGPSGLEELEQYFEVNRKLPIRKYADAFGFEYYEVHNETDLEAAIPHFFAETNAAILAIYTPNTLNAEVLREYFAYIRENGIKNA